jgi:hypothetical protein
MHRLRIHHFLAWPARKVWEAQQLASHAQMQGDLTGYGMAAGHGRAETPLMV